MKRNKKIHIVLGTKAQLIKMAPILYELNNRKIEYNFIFTGQHKETIDKLLKNFSIKKPDIILYKGKDITGIFQMLTWIIRISLKVLFNKKNIFGKYNKDDILLTHGDTFSTVLGAIMGKIGRIKVAHIESGLRSFSLFNPFPEEINRISTFYLSDYFFCPGKWAVNNLKKFKGEKINTHSNTLFDSLKLIQKNINKSNIKTPQKKYCICSIHRFENIFNKKKLKSILKNLTEISKQINIQFILHPPTSQQLNKFKLKPKLEKNKNIHLKPRYDYLNFINLLINSEFLITDGGSNQEECFYLGKPCLLLRKTTERNEGIGKNVVLSRYNKKNIKNFINNYEKFKFNPQKIESSPTKIIIDNII